MPFEWGLFTGIRASPRATSDRSSAGGLNRVLLPSVSCERTRSEPPRCSQDGGWKTRAEQTRALDGGLQARRRRPLTAWHFGTGHGSRELA